jgi:hypothetical protein
MMEYWPKKKQTWTHFRRVVAGLEVMSVRLGAEQSSDVGNEQCDRF